MPVNDGPDGFIFGVWGKGYDCWGGSRVGEMGARRREDADDPRLNVRIDRFVRCKVGLLTSLVFEAVEPGSVRIEG